MADVLVGGSQRDVQLTRDVARRDALAEKLADLALARCEVLGAVPIPQEKLSRGTHEHVLVQVVEMRGHGVRDSDVPLAKPLLTGAVEGEGRCR